MPDKAAIYKEILQEYEKERNHAQALAKNHQAVVYKKIPRIEQIDKEINLIGVKISKLVLNHVRDSFDLMAELKEETTRLNMEKRTLLQKNGFPIDYLKAVYHCDKCNDTGYIGNIKCSCLQQKFVDKAYHQSNLKQILKTENFDFFDFRYYSDQVDPKENTSPKENIQLVFSTCMKFTNEFDEQFRNLLLHGKTGLGKTFLCNCIAKELLDKGKTVLYVTAGQLFRMIENDRFQRGEKLAPTEYMDDILSVDLFIIDDLGTEFSTLLSSAELFHIVNTRLLEKKSTIISTNLKPSEMIDQYSDRIVSRIAGNYVSLKFFGDDIRSQKKYAQGKKA